TLNAGTRQHIDVSLAGDPSHGAMGPQRTSSLIASTAGSFSELNYGSRHEALRYVAAVSSRWLLETSVAEWSDRINETPSVDEWRVTDLTVMPRVVSGGIGLYEAGNRGSNKQYAIKSTNLVGHHQFKYGFEYGDVEYLLVN